MLYVYFHISIYDAKVKTGTLHNKMKSSEEIARVNKYYDMVVVVL